MQIKSLTLKNFRGFKDTEITFSEGLTVLVGVNGAGKSSVLDALAILLSCAINRLAGESGVLLIKETDTYAGEESASVQTRVYYAGQEYSWRATTTGKNAIGPEPDGGANETALFLKLLESLSTPGTGKSVPIVIYYPANRAVTTVPIPPPEDAKILQRRQTYVDSFPMEFENFHSFFKWFRAREDYENERIREEAATRYQDSELDAVRAALRECLPHFSNFTVRRFQDTITADKNGLTIRLDRLSDGEKILIASVGDIARRLALAAPDLKNPLEGEGVVLIDEIEQHLHPEWQRKVIGNLRRTFPNVQFIVSTHSPQVLGEVNHENIRFLDFDSERGQQAYVPTRSLGLDSSTILEEIFDTGRRNNDVRRKLDSIFELIDADEFEQAAAQIDALEAELGANIPELIEARTMIAMLGGVGAEHH